MTLDLMLPEASNTIVMVGNRKQKIQFSLMFYNVLRHKE